MDLGGPEAFMAVRQPLAPLAADGVGGVDLEAAENGDASGSSAAPLHTWGRRPQVVENGDVVGSPVAPMQPWGQRPQAGPWSGAASSSSAAPARGPGRSGPQPSGERSTRSLRVEAAFAKAAAALNPGAAGLSGAGLGAAAAGLRGGGGAAAASSGGAGLGIAAEDTSVRRRLQGGTAIGARRGTTPIRSSADARSKLERSLRADGACYAVCMGGKFDLEGLSTTLAPRAGEGVNQVCEDSPPSPPPSLNAPLPPPATGSPPSPGSESEMAPSWWSRFLRRGGPAAREKTPRSKVELGLCGAEFVKAYGTGENSVVHLKVFRGKDLFAFTFGCLVCWSFDRRELAAAKEGLRPFMVRPIPAADMDEEVLDFLIKRRGEGEEDEDEQEEDEEDAATNSIKQDQIILTTTSPLERLAHAYALAQSVKLGSFEIVVGRSIGSTRSIPETMASTGEVQLDARELSKRIGGLLMLRCDVNLHTDILDTPEIFWDEEKFEPHYVACRGYLDIDKRVEILNQRLGVLKDLYDLLQNSLNVKHGNKLEWIVIILILVEVLLELLELLHDAWAG